MNISVIQWLFDYNYWANHLILDRTAALSQEQVTQPNTFPYGSLLGTLEHLLDAEYVWRTILQNRRYTSSLVDNETFPTFDSIVTYWEKEEAAMRAYLNSLQDSDLDTIVRYEIPDGVRERVLWQCLVHVVNHGTQHRSECAQMLTNFGHSPGDIDMTLYMNKRAGIK